MKNRHIRKSCSASVPSRNWKSHSSRSLNIDEDFEPAPESLSMSDDYIDSSLCVHCLNACTRWAADIDQEGMEYTHWNDIAELEGSAANGCMMCTQLLQSRTNGTTERAKEDIRRLGPTCVHSTLSFLRLNTKSSRDEPNVVLEYAALSTETQREAQESDDESKVVLCTYSADMIRMDSSGACSYAPSIKKDSLIDLQVLSSVESNIQNETMCILFALLPPRSATDARIMSNAARTRCGSYQLGSYRHTPHPQSSFPKTIYPLRLNTQH